MEILMSKEGVKRDENEGTGKEVQLYPVGVHTGVTMISGSARGILTSWTTVPSPSTRGRVTGAESATCPRLLLLLEK